MASFTQKSFVSCYGPNPVCTRGESFQISVSPDGSKIIYPVGPTVVIRDVANPSECEVYTEHKAPVTVAKFSPNGNYVASGDEKGVLRIWAYDHPEKLTKKEMPCIGGKILDLAWDGEGKRIVVGGDPKASNAKVFMWESGSSQGELTGATKGVLSVDLRPTKPGRLITGSEDFKSRMYSGPPFKFTNSNSDHSNFVQCVRFSPDGSKFVTVSNDSNVHVYDGESGSKIGSLPKEHKGSIYACAWHQDSKRLVTASGDKTVKLWDVDAKKCLETFNVSPKPQVQDMQVGVTFAGDDIVSVSLRGELLYLKGGKAAKVVQGSYGMPAVIRHDWINGNGNLYAGDTAGSVTAFDAKGNAVKVDGEPHSAQVVDMCVTNGFVYSVGWDDTLRAIDVKKNAFASKKVSLGAQPCGVAASTKIPDLVAVATNKGLLLVRAGKVVDQINTEKEYQPTCVSISAGGTEVVVGGSDKAAHVYKVSKDKLSDNKVTFSGLQGGVTAVAHSPDGKFVAVGDKIKEITLWDRKSGEVVVRNKWVFHTSAITDLAFSPSSEYLASTSVDSAVIVWNVAKPLRKSQMKLAHSNGSASVTFADDSTVFSTGGDMCIRQWKPELPK